MTNTAKNLALHGVTAQQIVHDLVQYLPLIGWREREASNNKWIVFQGSQDIHGEPLEIVLPRSAKFPDTDIYIATAIDLLAAINDNDPEDIIKIILNYDRDVFSLRNLDTGEEQSIALELAYKQVSEFRKLITYATIAEQRTAPFHYASQVTSLAKKMPSRYRFGHTFVGSFGMTFESPTIIPSVPVKQYSFLDKYGHQVVIPEEENVFIPPIERRILERIMRGLVAIEQAPQRQDMNYLVNYYSSGFTANMCEAVAEMTQQQRPTVEFSVRWSPRVPTSEDLQAIQPIRLGETSYEYLVHIADRLRKLQPEPQTVRGLVVQLSSPTNPRRAAAGDLAIVVRWSDRPEGRPLKVLITVDPDTYLTALEAHKEGLIVQVTGTLKQVGSIWQIDQPRDFQIT